ncbi:MAG: serine hydrolase domain-containing protein [Planctomycetia bacterium]|nr:serine hydrolase domain-containing protein [Planctomycetia bacterium]
MNRRNSVFHVEQIRTLLVGFLLLVSASVFAQGSGRIQKAMQPILDSGKLAGYVGIRGTVNGITEWEWGGYADLKNKVPMQKDSLFWIASMSKPITATAVLMLVDEGKISLDDPLDKFFPEFKNAFLLKTENGKTVVQRIKKSPTVRQLLSHTAGLEFITPYMSKFGIDSLPPQKLAYTASLFPFKYEPGTGYQYSNTGIDIASAILEKVSGLSLEEFLQTRLFDPLEMKDTTFYPSKEQMARLAKSYKWNKEKKVLEETNIGFLNEPYSDRAIRFPEGGGGLFSTAEDSFRFHQMLAAKGVYKGKRILSEKAIDEMSKVQTGFENHKYGLGMNVDTDSFGHGGAHATNGRVYKKEGKVVIFMIQFAGGGTNASEAARAFVSSEQK